MAKSTGIVWEVRPATGSDAYGGMFLPGTSGTVDYSQQNAPQLSVTDGVANGTTTITSATGGFTAAIVNNGLNFNGVIYQITAYTNTNTVTVDSTVATASAATINVGGALKTSGMAGSSTSCNSPLNVIYINGTDTLTVAGAGSGGIILTTSSNGGLKIQGYGTTRGDNGLATIDGAALNLSSVGNYILNDYSSPGGQGIYLRNMKIIGSPTAGCVYWQVGNENAFNCYFQNGYVAPQQASSVCVACIYDNVSSGGGVVGNSVYCDFINNSVMPGVAIFCMSDQSSKEGMGYLTVGCTMYGVTSGDAYVSTDGTVRVDCHAEDCQQGYNVYNIGNSFPLVINCSQFGETTASDFAGVDVYNYISATIDPLAAASTQNFTPNANSQISAKAWNNRPYFTTTTSKRDIGAAQSSASGGGGVPRIVVPRRMW